MSLSAGDKAPAIKTADFSLSSLKGKTVVLYFYPKADTPGCTTQACGLRDIAGEIGDTVVLGISPDAPARLRKFRDKYDLGFTLLSDAEHTVAEAVEQTFKVTVRRVNIQNYRGKNKRGRNGRPSVTADYKKAIVTLKAGDKIELV